MAAISPGSKTSSRPVSRPFRTPSSKSHKPTQTTKAHRFEPFSRRLARLKIDPVHRVSRASQPDENQVSNFHNSLEHWTDLNLSQDFTDFSTRASPLCETLPQLLYHADTLAALLLEFIGRRNALSLEPLLSLLAHFAHDLGPRFEQYFSESVSAVAEVAAKHESPEAIEWSFTCLAWIFKFLWRLLVPDLQPLLRIMIPYLGKTQQKDYIIRFTADSIAYLVRKAANAYSKDRRPLKNAISPLLDSLEDICDEGEIESYQNGIMYLLSETIKGVNNAIHECGSAVVGCLVDCMCERSTTTVSSQGLLPGIWTNALHHTTPETAAPLVQILIEMIGSLSGSGDRQRLEISISLAFITVGLRKGSRITDWTGFNETLLRLSQCVVDARLSLPEARRSLLASIVLSVCYSPLDGLLTLVTSFSDLILSREFSENGIFFFGLLMRLSPEKFEQFFGHTLQHFLNIYWEAQETGLLAFMIGRQEMEEQHSVRSDISLKLPADWEAKITQFMENMESKFDRTSRANAYLSLIGILGASRKAQTFVVATLHNDLESTLSKLPLPLSDSRHQLALGRGFETYNSIAQKLDSLDDALWPALCGQISNSGTFPAFLDGLVQFVDSTGAIKTASHDQVASIVDAMGENVLLDDTSIKKSSIKLLKSIEIHLSGSLSESLEIASEILDTLYNVQSVRQLSMLIRRLSSLWDANQGGPSNEKIVPHFLLGLLSPKTPQIHEQISQSLAQICTTTVGEVIVNDVLTRWLASDSEDAAPDAADVPPETVRTRVSPFQCSNVESVRECARESIDSVDNADARLHEGFEKYHRIVSPTHSGARSLAIRIFQALPELAERKSRQLVPLLLSSVNFDNPSDWSPASDVSSTSATLSTHDKVQNWSFRDRKAMLELFAKFQNPKVLFRSPEVYSALLDVLARGNTEMQKLALKVIFTFKNSSVRPYEEHLLNLTDDKRFREELSVLFHADAESTTIEAAHRDSLLPIMLRLLYGQMINRSGSHSNHGGQQARRKAILRTLFRLKDHEIQHFLEISCGPLAELPDLSLGEGRQDILMRDLIPPAQQYGSLNVMETMLDTLQSQLHPFVETLRKAALYCLARACRRLGEVEEYEAHNHESLTRRTRRLAIRCIVLIFVHCPELDWGTSMPLLFEEAIVPRLENFAVETAQGTSGLLQLFSVWSSTPQTVGLLKFYDQDLLNPIGNCLTVASARDEVKIFVMNDILIKLCQTVSDSDDEKSRSVIQRPISHLLTSIDTLLRQNPSRKVQDTAILALSKLSSFATTPESSQMLLQPLVLILRQPSEKVSPHTKGNLLTALHDLLLVPGLQTEDATLSQMIETISSMFDFFRDHPNRQLLVKVLEALAMHEASMKIPAGVCADLNAQSTTRLDEPDYGRRLHAFNSLHEAGVSGYSTDQWLPILNNIIYFCREEDDFAIRSNAVAVLRMLIQESCQPDAARISLTKLHIYPALKRALKASSETIRADHLSMIGVVVQNCHSWRDVSDMQGLLANNDEEASFFNNALHIQQHRRLRALRRLETEIKAGSISSGNVTAIFLPLLEHFVFEVDDDATAQNLAGQAIITIGKALEATEWTQFKAIFRRYKSYMGSKPEVEKNVIKVLSAAADSLYRCAHRNYDPDAALGQLDEAGLLAEPRSKLQQTVPQREKISEELASNFIPDLTAFVHQKEESEISLRIPIAIAAVRLLKILSEERMALLLPPLLLDICYILRSRVQESRDVARRTLSEISAILGPSCFGYIVKELRTSLARGYQLHVLSYTVHSILVSMTDTLQSGDIDYCLPILVAVVMDDIFGVVGQEKDAEDYVSKMREVKSSKSLDSMELLAKTSTIGHLKELIKPTQALLSESLNARQAKQVDELLRRIGVGVSRNPHASSRDVLVFSFEIIQDCYAQQSRPTTGVERTFHEQAKDRFIIDFKSRKQHQPHVSNAMLKVKMVRFALDLLRSTLQKHTELSTPENVHGFLPVIGDALVEGQEEVTMSAMRLLSSIIKLPMRELDENGPLYAAQAVKVIKGSTSTNAESSQAALKLVTAILRDRPHITIRDSDIGYLLHRVQPDLDEPDLQGVTFNFVRAVMARKIALPEVYDLVEQLGTMMVTNQTRSTRDAARGVYVHFLLDYPQSKGRWAKQLKFLVKNLDYQYPEGRQSVMEAVHVLLSKSGDAIAQDLVASFFIPVVLTLSNDDSSQCREMAAALLGQLFERADEDQTKSLLSSLRSWTEQIDNHALAKAGMQAFKLFFTVDAAGAKKELDFVRARIEDLVQNDSGEPDDDSWEPTYHALQLLSKLVVMHPEAIMSDQQSRLWRHIQDLLDHRHTWIQHSAANLIGSVFQDAGRANAESGLQSVPLSNTHGLLLERGDMVAIAKSSLRIIKRYQTDDELRTQTIRNLVFLGRCFNVNGVTIDLNKSKAVQSDSDSDSDSQDPGDSFQPLEHLPAVQYLFHQLASILRREPRVVKSQYLAPKLSSLHLLAALLAHTSPVTLLGKHQTQNSPPLHQVLLPLLHITSTSTPTPLSRDQSFQSVYATLTTTSTELLDLIQKKLGSRIYIEEMSKVQKLARERREGRRTKRRIEAVRDP